MYQQQKVFKKVFVCVCFVGLSQWSCTLCCLYFELLHCEEGIGTLQGKPPDFIQISQFYVYELY